MYIFKAAKWRRLRGRWHHCVTLLLVGVLMCLLIPALTPHPNPTEPRHPLRRIHQEKEDYTAPKGISVRDDDDGGDGSMQRMATFKDAHGKVYNEANRSRGHPNNQSGHFILSQPDLISSIDVPRVFPKLDPNALLDHRARVELVRAQETALNAMQHGYRLTERQKQLLKNLTPKARKELEEKLTKTMIAQDKVYITHLRSRKQIQPRKGGGEEVVSTSVRTVRFPTKLKKTPIPEWPVQYRIYQNLTHYPWIKSSGCENFSITFAPPDSLPAGGLASFPSSGNTWIRYLIEGATGIFTGSMYDDTSLMMKGLYGEGLVYDSGMTILQKSHGFTTGDAMTIQDREERAKHNHLQELGYRGVVVIRNPFKALISHRHLDVGGHTGYAPKAHFIGQGWSEFVRLKARLWRDFYEDWLSKTRPTDTHVTHYENLRDDPVKEMKGVLTYLDLSHNEDRLRCLGRNLDGLFKRKPRTNLQLNFDPFTAELRGVVYEAITTVDSILVARGKKGLPLAKYEIYNATEARIMGYS